MATLNVPLTTDFSADLLSNITRIKFINFAAATATFDASQFDNLAVLDDVLLVGSVGENLVEVNGGSVDASDWRFSGWEQDYDSITLNGSSLADTITGSRRADTITGRNGGDVLSGMNGGDVIKGGRGSDIISGGRGADMLLGGKQADTFHYADQTEIAAGESIDGGDGTDGIVLDGAGIEYDFQAVSIANTEELQFTDGGTATFDGAQIGGGTDLFPLGVDGARVVHRHQADLDVGHLGRGVFGIPLVQHLGAGGGVGEGERQFDQRPEREAPARVAGRDHCHLDDAVGGHVVVIGRGTKLLRRIDVDVDLAL